MRPKGASGSIRYCKISNPLYTLGWNSNPQQGGKMGYVVAIRNAEGERNIIANPPLTVRGQEDTEKLHKILKTYFKGLFPNGCGKLAVSLSQRGPAYQTTVVLARSCPVIALQNAVSFRDSIREPVNIGETVLGFMRYCQANVCIVVACGIMPAVLAEVLRDKVQDRKGGQFDLPDFASGYIINLDDGIVQIVSPKRGIRPLIRSV